MPTRPTKREVSPQVSSDCFRDRSIDLASVLVMIPVLLPLVVVFAPSLYFDTDPRGLTVLDHIEFGPAGSVWLAAGSVLIAAIALAVTAWAGGRIRWWSCGLIAAGVIPCLVHIPNHFNSRLHGSAWIAAATLGLAAAHLGQFQRAKRLMLTAMIAMALPLCLQSAWYVYVEHPQTVRSFLETERESLAARGIEFGSAAHAKYLTRLQGPDVIGAVGMSNVLGSIVSMITLLSLVCAVGAWRLRTGWGRTGAMTAVLFMSGWALVLTLSKGALLSLLAAVGLGVCVLILTRHKKIGWRVLPSACVCLVLAGSVAVLARGAMGPPDGPGGERSLLFRFHYWQGAVRLLTDEPSRVLVGVGQGTFQDQYEAVRNPISPEVVSSTHNVFVDYLVMLGAGGLAWCGLLLRWLWRAGSVMGGGLAELTSRDLGPPGSLPGSPPVKRFGLLAAVVFGTQYAVQLPGLYAQTAILWLVGMLGFVALAAWVIYPAMSGGRAWLNMSAGLAAVLVLLHAQIELTFFWDSAAALFWVIVGLASAKSLDVGDKSRSRSSYVGYLPAGCALALAVYVAVAVALPTDQHQSRLASASKTLRLMGPPAAVIELDQAAAIIANDPVTTRWRVQLREEIAMAWIAAGRPGDAQAVLNEAMAVLDQAQRAGFGRLFIARRKGSTSLDAYDITGDRAWLRRAAEHLRTAVELSPNGLNDHVKLADTLWKLGKFDPAQATYRRALDISDNYYLDPDTQLPEDQRRRIEARISDDETP